jgi:hypothetical protein
MKPEIVLVHEFVESVPDELRERTLYVSIRFATVIHKCCCGCGRQVVTPLSPTRWKLTFDGKTISLYPSIGNWSMPCRSHYWIERNRVKWAKQWPQEQIRDGKTQDSMAKEKQFNAAKTPADHATSASVGPRSRWRDWIKCAFFRK